MAERQYTVLREEHFGPNIVYLVQWTGLLNGDTGAALIHPRLPDRNVQVKGTFGVGGNCKIEGSNDDTSPVWATLNDPQGNALNMASASAKNILENTYQIRPNVTGGDGTTSLTVTILLRN